MLAGAFKNGVYEERMQVRDYELDQFSVVHNSVYAGYLAHARHEALNALGSPPDEFAQRGMPLAISELNMRFLRPLRSREVFVVTVAITRVTAARMVIRQEICKVLAPENGSKEQRETVVEADTVVVFLDSNYKPTRIPQDVKEKCQGLIREQTAAGGGDDDP